jgi:hypothetical protein
VTSNPTIGRRKQKKFRLYTNIADINPKGKNQMSPGIKIKNKLNVRRQSLPINTKNPKQEVLGTATGQDDKKSVKSELENSDVQVAKQFFPVNTDERASFLTIVEDGDEGSEESRSLYSKPHSNHKSQSGGLKVAGQNLDPILTSQSQITIPKTIDVDLYSPMIYSPSDMTDNLKFFDENGELQVGFKFSGPAQVENIKTEEFDLNLEDDQRPAPHQSRAKMDSMRKSDATILAVGSKRSFVRKEIFEDAE